MGQEFRKGITRTVCVPYTMSGASNGKSENLGITQWLVLELPKALSFMCLMLEQLHVASPSGLSHSMVVRFCGKKPIEWLPVIPNT